MSRKFTFLFTPMDAVGHTNACIGLGQELRDRGHRVVFATPNDWRGKLAALGFEERGYTTKDEVEAVVNSEYNDNFGAIAAAMAPAMSEPAEKQVGTIIVSLIQECIRQTKYSHDQMKKILEDVQPDVCIADIVVHCPAVCDSGIPWVMCRSINPMTISEANVPPALFGFPTGTPGPHPEWDQINQEIHQVFDPIRKEFSDWVMAQGGPDISNCGYPITGEHSPYANIYMYPKELDYTTLRPNPPNWYQFDTFMRKASPGGGHGEEGFEIPEKLRGLPGKLIYFSMGTIGCSELGLMKRLVGILAKSPNRFIVSKGPLAHKYDLADNMWGAASVPQLKVIPAVDMVITHGGNNSFTESLYYGTPVIVLPLFVDQHDNGQRIYELGLGYRFHPYHVKEEELLGAIEKTLGDELLHQRIRSISTRLQKSNSLAGAGDVIDGVAMKHSKKKAINKLINKFDTGLTVNREV